MELYHYCCFGIWVVYKFKNFIPSGTLTQSGSPEQYKTYNEARFKTYKSVKQQFPDKDIHLEDVHDKSGPYFIVKVVVGIIEFIFIPIKK